MSMKRLLHGIGWFFLVFMTAFATAALFYSTVEPAALRISLTVLCPTSILAAFLGRRYIPDPASLATIFIIFWGWYLTDPPRNDRDWAGEYALPANAALNGRVAHIEHVRNFTYRTTEDYTPHYYDADYNLDDLSSLDLVTSYWAGETIAHVFLSFGFKDGRHLALSIETRRQKTFAYSAIAGFFHHYETFYVAADERDLIGVRTDIRKERVYLYTLTLSPQARERLLLSYLAEIHRLTLQPAWYNTLTDNCTTGILTRAQAKWRYRLDWRVLLSGYTASLAYDLGLLQTHGLSFPALKQASRLYRPANAVPGNSFSKDIRTKTIP